MKKVILVLVDGMRSDSLAACGNEYAVKFAEENISKVYATTVMPTVTLPCHFSLFKSVNPDRHGILSNTYVPLVRPIPSLLDVMRRNGRKCGMFYNWEELRDLNAPGTLTISSFITTDVPDSDEYIATEALKNIAKYDLDCSFVYLDETDECGHRHGWMGEAYLDCVSRAWGIIHRLRDAFPDYVVIVTADHGGHEHMHGADIPEDLQIPIIISGEGLEASEKMESANIIDIAPTIAAIMGVEPDDDWRGVSLVK